MAPNKRTPTARAHDLELIATLYLKGKRQTDIASELGITQQQVSYDLKEIHERWRESTLVTINEVKHRELARIDQLEITYWQAWQRSLETKHRTRTERNSVKVPLRSRSRAVVTIKLARDKTSIEREDLLGNPAYLQGVQWCIEQRCKIFGIYEATKITFDWRKAVEAQGHDAGNLFEQMVNAYIAAIDPAPNGEDDR